MDAYEAILTRRSIRAYTTQPISEALITDLLKAAMNAPSASNQQPWQFIVITDRKRLDRLAAILPFGKMLTQAPLAIAVCGDLNVETSKGYWVQDCSAATQNILLAAHAGGLGAVWIGVFPRPERIADVQSQLGLPETVIPLNVIAIGYPAETRPPTNRFNQSRVHNDHW